jgi:hypothetical protein
MSRPAIGVMTLLARASSLPPCPIGVTGRRSWVSVACHPFSTNLIIFFLLSLIVFRCNAEFLFYGGDGTFEASLLAQFPVFIPPLFGFTSDVLCGLGNVIFAVNPYWIPAYFLPLSWQGDYSNFALTYAICASEIFAAIYLTARLLQLPQMVGVASAWLAPLNDLAVFRLRPHSSHGGGVSALWNGLAVSTVPATTCSAIGGRSPGRYVAGGIILAVGISFVVAIAPTLWILALPTILASSLLCCINSANRREVLLKLSTFGLAAAACLAAYGPFVAGLLLDTTASFFRDLSMRPATLQDISMLFWNPIYSLTHNASSSAAV